VEPAKAQCLCLAALVALSLTTGCGKQETESTNGPAFVAPAFTPDTPNPEIAPVEPQSTKFPHPPACARNVASQFAIAFLTYDTRSERARDFLHKVRPLTTQAVVEELGRSPRSRLPWRVMRFRRERVSLSISGTSITTSNRAMTVLVNGVATTRTDLAMLRNPVVLRLQISNTRNGWKVIGVHGGGS
jgi:hypothetical protein